MSWYKTNLKLLRQERVAYWRARGLSQRAILEKLSLPPDEGGLRNPETGLPYTNGVIAQDCLELDARWQEEAARSTADHKGRILGELEQAKAAAWEIGGEKGIGLVIKILAREILLLGLGEVQVKSYNLNVDFASLTDEQIKALAAGEDPALVLGQPAQVVEGEAREVSSRQSDETLDHVIHGSSEEKDEAGLGEGRLGEGEDG